MEKLVNKNFERNFFSFIFYFFLICIVGFIVKKIYQKKNQQLVLFSFTNKNLIALNEEDLIFVYLIDSIEQFEKIVLHLGPLFQFASSLSSRLVFVVRSSNKDKLQDLFFLHSIPEPFFHMNRLLFWKLSQGNMPTLLVLKEGKILHSVYGLQNWGLKNAIADLSSAISSK